MRNAAFIHRTGCCRAKARAAANSNSAAAGSLGLPVRKGSDPPRSSASPSRPDPTPILQANRTQSHSIALNRSHSHSDPSYRRGERGRVRSVCPFRSPKHPQIPSVLQRNRIKSHSIPNGREGLRPPRPIKADQAQSRRLKPQNFARPSSSWRRPANSGVGRAAVDNTPTARPADLAARRGRPRGIRRHSAPWARESFPA